MLRIHLAERRAGRDAGIVHQDVDRAERLFGAGDGQTDRLFVRNIGERDMGFGRQQRRGGFQGGRITPAERDNCAAGGEGPNDGRADSTPGAGHECVTSIERRNCCALEPGSVFGYKIRQLSPDATGRGIA